MGNNTIFDLQQSRKDAEFIAENAELELEVGADIIETVADVPYIGSLIKLYKVFHNYNDYRFFRKLGRFLKYANEIPEKEVTAFLKGLSTKDKKRISDYLTQLLYSAEDEEKADIMGKIYKRNINGEIDTNMMLRLCSIVNKCFVADLGHLSDYKDVSEKNDFVTDNLVALGLLADAGNMYKESGDGWEGTGFGPAKHTLNEVGLTLCQIIYDETVKSKKINRIEDTFVLERPLSTDQMNTLTSMFPTSSEDQ